ncbi:MAG TPA: hypothetical protein DD379_09580 [Cyanobacteria bacterium UBA11162]|nr:hypothetical protein [Cyanobacteria bacterium UBA12227]HAX88278.1 hypothetical protein [Cyanobacteria bacterium UBA11370]HBL11642.1 hypothetical protein [Cyanobacteria bacterium UBA11162]HBY81701.1 hypothetical protein [Cyanobacteria bacterium UBA11148]
MTYVNRPTDSYVTDTPVVNQVIEYHDRVRWGPIISGIVVALATQLILSALGAAIGSTFLAGSGAPRSNAPGVGTGVGIWSVISLLISLFLGSWVAARACGPINRNTALLNGAILWATTLALSSWLVASGVTGAFGIAASNAGEVINQVQQGDVNLPNNQPTVTADQARAIADNAAKGLWSFVIGSLLGLAASLAGASTGAQSPRVHRVN